MISKFSVKKPYTVLVGVVLAIVLGVVAFTKSTADLLPNISLPYVLIMTTYPGASPETVEMVVTQPMEASMATVSNIEQIQSVSNENYSMVILEFAQSTDMNAASLEIRESLDQIKSYWDDSVGNPVMIKLNPNMLPVMIAAAGVKDMDNAQISTYVQEHVIPELESIEGVASASATGLLEESVNVIIRQEKIDKVNEKVYAAIDVKMEDARQEIEDGKKKIEDGQKELDDGRKEIKKGQKELKEGEKKLQDGEKTLGDKQSETAAQLATTKQQLLTAKADLEAAKISINTNLTTARMLDQSIKEIDMILTAPIEYAQAIQMLNSSVSSGDAGAQAEAVKKINDLKAAYTGSQVFAKVGELVPETIQENETLSQIVNTLTEAVNNSKNLDWTDPKNSNTVIQTLSGVTLTYGIMMNAQNTKLKDALNAMTSGMGLEAYEKTIAETLATIDQQLTLVDNGLVEVEKGQLTAAVEFSKAATELSIGKYQIDATKTQLNSALEQLKTGQQQLDDAKKQLEEGEEKFEEAKEDAYEQADMINIVTIDMVKGLLTAQNFSMPAGYVTEEGVDYLIRVGDKPTDIEELKKIPLLDLHMDGVPVITLEDVADVFYTDNSDAIYTNVNGNPGVMLTIQKQTGYSTGDVSDRLKARFDELMKNDPDLSIITLMDQGIYIDIVMNSIVSNVLWGAALAILILILFLKDLRPTAVIACSIPISLVTAIVCMYFSGITLNVISLSGLALGIGMLVDNSIVVIENIYRLRNEGYSMVDAAIAGAKEVAGAILASTLTTVCVFLPIVFTEGITRQLFVDMGLTIGYSLMASLIIALTVVPAMASKVLTKTEEKKEGKFLAGLINVYEKVLKLSLKFKPLLFLLVIGLLVVSGLAAYSRGTAFMPDMDSTQLTVNVKLGDDALLQDTAKVSNEVVDRLLAMDEVEDVGAMLQQSTLSMLGGGGASTKATSIYVVTKEDKKRSNEELAEVIVEMMQDLDATVTVDTSTIDMSALGGSGISIEVRGRDLDKIREIAQEVAEIVRSVEGTKDVKDGVSNTDEELRISVDKDKAVKYGLTVAQVFMQINAKISEASSATVLVEADKDYNVYVKHGNDTELSRKDLEKIEIDCKDEEGAATTVILSEIATFSTAKSFTAINRIDQTRYVGVSAGLEDGYNIGKVANAVNAKLNDYKVPDGYRLVFSGENETINEALVQVGLMLLLALVFMYLIMVAQFQSLLSPFIIMFTIPLAFTGGLFGLYFSKSEISVIAMVGFVMLAGIIVNNGIVLIDYMNQLRESGMRKYDAIITAGRTRLRPVLMTALTTILALSTMVLGNDMGSEMGKPMATVAIGGLLYGTLLTLVVVPCIYDIFTKKDKPTDQNPVSESEMV